jgi:hypothetical protein
MKPVFFIRLDTRKFQPQNVKEIGVGYGSAQVEVGTSSFFRKLVPGHASKFVESCGAHVVLSELGTEIGRELRHVVGSHA